MAQARTVINGIVLRGTDTRESDKILTILSPAGKLAVIAKGARGQKSRLSAAAQLLAYSELTITGGKTWLYLAEAATIELFSGVRQDIELLSLASYFAELTEAVTDENMECGEILRLLLNALYALGELKKPPVLVKAAFELKLMALAGFEPMADSCAVCGRPDPQKPVLDLGNGVVRCQKCLLPGRGQSVRLTGKALGAMRYVLYGDEKRLYSFRLPEEDLRSLANAAELYVRATLDRKFRTLDFYHSLRPLDRKDS
ncbi:MAG: DNA repair protein RecO [Oscillospiraceae bacterium]|nr:DNA repair protein RecO [Oscillospiraceae bacterium]